MHLLSQQCVGTGAKEINGEWRRREGCWWWDVETELDDFKLWERSGKMTRNRLELRGSWLPSPSLCTLVDSCRSCAGWRKWMLTFWGSGLVDDEWSYPAEEHVSSPQRDGEDVSLTPLGPVFFFLGWSRRVSSASVTAASPHWSEERPQLQLTQWQEITTRHVWMCCAGLLDKI